MACIFYQFSTCFSLQLLFRKLHLEFFHLILRVVLCSCGRFGILVVWLCVSALALSWFFLGHGFHRLGATFCYCCSCLSE
jgi:hypothetical protein